ncbi:hypothetical protein Shyhy01_15380 [Streptomyces hygroscopicus subsp. hygroscopicus]|nr:hypothetical protein Shyhy01_15380 [Streptomyces hygroscopicus subsp. hygroscopicus]
MNPLWASQSPSPPPPTPRPHPRGPPPCGTRRRRPRHTRRVSGSTPRRPRACGTDSPTCDGSTVTGIGRDKVGRIWYRALTVLTTSSTDYAGARTATLDAAKDLYGAGGTEYDAVAAAWSAVNVN